MATTSRQPSASRLGVDRVVEIARVLAVDGDQRHVAQVGAAALVGGGDLRSDAAGVIQRAAPASGTECGTSRWPHR